MDKKFRDLAESYMGLRMSDGCNIYVGAFIAIFLFQTVLSLICNACGWTKEDINNPPYWFTYVIMILNQSALIAAVFAYGAIVKRPIIKDCRITRSISWRQGLMLPVITVVCIMAFYPLAAGFVEFLNVCGAKDIGVGIKLGEEWWQILLSIIFVAVLPAIGEEVLFRGSVARGIKKRGYVFSIIISGLLFSIFHGNAAQTVHQFLIGMVFAYVYFTSGSLLASMIVHFVNNAVTIVLDVILTKHLPATVPADIIIPVYVTMSIVGFILLYFLLRAYMAVCKQEARILDPDSDKFAWAKDIGRAFTPKGIVANWKRLDSSLAALYNDPTDEVVDNTGMQTIDSNMDAELSKMLEKSNAKIQYKRSKYDWISLAVAVGLAMIVWVINLANAFAP